MKDYDYKILYHLVNANVVVDALILKAIMATIRDIFMRITVITPLVEPIREAQVEPMKEKL
jgi:hypothetical protein